jgi:hypothetical protein
MVGSIVDNAATFTKTYTYVPPTSSAELIDGTQYDLDFNARNFITIGLDVTDDFNITVQMTSSRYVKLTPEFLKHMFSLMSYIFSNILGARYKKIIFLDTEKYKLSTMRYRDENVLVIESNMTKGCRVLLNRLDLLTLQNLETSIFETIESKKNILYL